MITDPLHVINQYPIPSASPRIFSRLSGASLPSASRNVTLNRASSIRYLAAHKGAAIKLLLTISPPVFSMNCFFQVHGIS
jgi:hypothetical protein